VLQESNVTLGLWALASSTKIARLEISRSRHYQIWYGTYISNANTCRLDTAGSQLWCCMNLVFSLSSCL
jgi:hypothetical protein